MDTEVIAVFDIGKTNKKILLFNKERNIEYEEERKFLEINDDEGFEYDDINAIEEWLSSIFNKLLADEKFILLSTGTWCINMNPFNEDPLTKEQLEQDCLSYMSINQKPVKYSRFFM